MSGLKRVRIEVLSTHHSRRRDESAIRYLIESDIQNLLTMLLALQWLILLSYTL